MMRPRASSLFWRLTIGIAVLLAAGAAVLMWAARNYARAAADDAYDRILFGAAEQISETIGAVGGVVSVDIPMTALETLSAANSDQVFYNVIDTDGHSITGYSLLKPPKSAALAGTGSGDAEILDVPVRVASVRRFVSDAARPGYVTTVVAHTLDARTRLTAELSWNAFLLVGLTSLLALVGVMVAVRLALRPLRRVEVALATRDPADFSVLDVETPREIGTLVAAINTFMLRLSDRLAVLQAHVTDVAHQIRTPMTALTAQIELALDETDSARRTQRLERVRDRAAELNRLTHQLLSHAMVLHRAEAIIQAPVDLKAVVAEALRTAVPETLERDIAVVMELPENPVIIAGDGVSLAEAVKNLIDNAVSHGARTRIRIRLSEGEGEVRLAVADDGPGIAEADRARALSRFGRGATEAPGSGLGLAIVSDVAAGHGGSVRFERTEEGDFAVVLVLAAGEGGAT
jgi:two-component system sensor histidine kinase TctE